LSVILSSTQKPAIPFTQVGMSYSEDSASEGGKTGKNPIVIILIANAGRIKSLSFFSLYFEKFF